MSLDYRLNPIIDGSLAGGGNLAAMAARAAAHGATLIQYRDKTAATRLMIDRARAIRAALAGSGVPLVVNDRVDVALAIQADGVHLGREDMDPATARALLGPQAIIGLTVKSTADAKAALAAPLNYACIGGVFETLSKDNPDPPLGLAGFAALRAHLRATRPDVPVGAIAGITPERARAVVAAGADGVAVIGAIFRAPDIASATAHLRAAVDTALRERAS